MSLSVMEVIVLGYPKGVRIKNPMFSPSEDKLLLLHTLVIPKEQKREAPESLYAGKNILRLVQL